MNPQNQQNHQEQNSAVTEVNNSLTVTQPGERAICTIKRHPIGILSIYVVAGILLVAIAVLAIGVVPHFIKDSSGSSNTATLVGTVVFLIAALVTLAFTFISSKVYWGNSWVLTTDSITQIEQDSLFNRQSSQLSLGNLEDVSAEQEGILPHMFNYGSIRVETAGERSKFVFTYCPNPNYYAEQILSAREGFEQGRHGEDLQRNFRSEDSYKQSPPQQQPPAA